MIHRFRFTEQTRLMPTQPLLPDSLQNLARIQAGVLTREQILGHGVSQATIDRLIGTQLWSRLSQGVYLAHALNPDWLSLAWAGTLTAGPGSAVGGRAALHLAGVLNDEELPISIVQPAMSHWHQGSGWWQFSRTKVPFRTVGDLPRLRVERAVIDLCACEPHESVNWVTLAINSRRASPRSLREALAELPRHPARRQLAEILADVGQGAESPLELVYLRDVERAHGMKPGRRQVQSGGFRCDIYYEEGLVVELDGRRGHEGIGAFRDMDRDNYHVMQGTPTLRYGWAHCSAEPCSVVAQVAAVRRQLGWTGQIKHCSRCRLAD